MASVAGYRAISTAMDLFMPLLWPSRSRCLPAAFSQQHDLPVGCWPEPGPDLQRVLRRPGGIYTACPDGCGPAAAGGGLGHGSAPAWTDQPVSAAARR